MPLISVHLAVKDSARTLPLAMRSTLSTLPRDAELLVLDDASSDDVGAALASVDDRRLRVVRNEISEGVGAARQRMLDQSDSRYVATMDADDVGLPGRFQLQRLAIDSADFVFGPVISFWEGSGRIRPGLPLPITAEAMPVHLLVHNLLCNPTLFARRASVVAAGGYRRTRAEDHDLWLRALAQGQRLVRLATPVLAYRHHARQTSSQSGFLSDSFAEPELRDAYRTFVLSTFGVEATWLKALWSSESGTEGVAKELAPLRALVSEKAKTLSPLQRTVLARTVRLIDMRLPVGRAT